MDGNFWILIVDDDDSVRGLMAMVLGLAGYSVTVAADASDAVQQCRQRGRAPSLLLCDVLLHPAFSGRDLARHLRLMYQDLKVLYVSGLVEAEWIEEETQGNPSTFLAKPFSPRGLVDHVKMAMGQYSEPTATVGA